MKIINTYRAPVLDTRAEDRWYVDYIEIEQDRLNICITCPVDDPTFEITEPSIFSIREPEVLSILPLLLNGEITCYKAVESLKNFFIEKYHLTPQIWQQSGKERLLKLADRLLTVNEDDFIALCLLIPGQETFRGKNLLSNIPTKIVSDEVISAIQEHYIFSYGRGAAVGALSAGESTKSIPIPALQLIGMFINRKDASVLAQTCKKAHNDAQAEYTRVMTNSHIS